MSDVAQWIGRRRTGVGAAISAVSALLIVGCHRTSTPPPDTLRGIVKVVGTAGIPGLVLQNTNRGGTLVPLRATEADAAALARVVGTVVAVRGEFHTADTLIVSSFRVVEVNGQSVVDGVVRQENGRFSVCPPGSACVSLGNPPEALRTLVGSRIWFAGPPATGPNTFGVIASSR